MKEIRQKKGKKKNRFGDYKEDEIEYGYTTKEDKPDKTEDWEGLEGEYS